MRPSCLPVIITRSVRIIIRRDGGGWSLQGSAHRLTAVWQTGSVRVYLGSDHAGLELKTALVAWLGEAGHEAVDCGPASYDPDDDYPVYVLRAAEGVIGSPGSLGIVIGGSGNGEQIAANKVPGIRAALAWTTETARLARQHNDANVLSLGARMYSTEDAVEFTRVFVGTSFSGEARHARRLAEIADFEKTGDLPPLPRA
jgi:ribose 5-phosphate isomerase B